jgi:hypothetical protein
MKKIIMLFMLLALSVGILSCGGGGAGSADTPNGENPGVPSVVKLLPSQFVAQTNSFISLHAQVLDGNGAPVSGVRVTFTNLSDPFGKITSAVLRFLGIHKAAALGTTTAKTNGLGIATVKITSTSSGFATVQAEVNRGSGTVRDKKTVFFSTYSLVFPGIPVPSPTLFLDVDTTSSFPNPNEPSDFVLFKTTGDDNQRFIRVTVFNSNGARVPGSIVTLGSDSTDLTYENGANEIIKITDANGQAVVTATVNPAALSQTAKTVNVTASADNGAFNLLTLFLEPVVIDGSASSLSASPTTVVVNGISTITANVKINTGGPAPDNTSVNFTTTCGAVDPFAETTDGVANATFTAPATVLSGEICTVSGKVAGVPIGSADITIVGALAVEPGSVSVTGIADASDTSDNVTFLVTGGTPGICPSPTYSVFSDNAAVVPNPGPVSCSAPFQFTINPTAVATSTAVGLTVVDSVGAIAKASVTVTPATASLGINPSTISVTTGTSISFNIIGGKPPYSVYSSNTDIVALDDNPYVIPPGTNPFTATTPGTGTATVTVVDTDAKTVTASVTVNALAIPPTPDFLIGCDASVTVPNPSSRTFLCSLTSQNGFSAPVTLTCPDLPAGTTCTDFNPASPVTPAANLTTSVIVTITNAGTVGPISPTFHVLGTSGSLSHTAAVTLMVP